MGEPPTGKTLDREERNGNYSPNNCRWASRAEQARNRDYCKLSKSDAESIRRKYQTGLGGVTQAELAAEFEVSQGLISQIIREAIWK